MSNIIEHELPEIIYDNSNHIIKCVISNIPIKRSIRKEIYKWIVDECIEYKYKRINFVNIIVIFLLHGLMVVIMIQESLF